MGKPEEVQLDIPDDGAGGLDLLRPCATALGGIGKAFTLRCAVVLVLSACVLLPAIFWLPPFSSFRSGFVPSDPDSASAEIQASFILQKPISLLAAESERLEYDIFEEIGVPNTKVSIVSMRSSALANSTYVVFGVLPDSRYALISSPALSVLKSSLVEMVLQQLNLSLTPSLFGHPSSFELLKFPGGITVIPVQTASIWERTQVLFNFTLNNSIVQIQKNLDELNYQLKYGLNLRSDENVYVQMTNANGSTVAPPVTVQASVLSDIGRSSLLPYRLKQLAQIIRGHHAKNLGLNHSVFGKVKEVRLSSYLQHSISSLAPSPSPSPSLTPSPSPSEDIPYMAPPISSDPTLSPSHAPSPSTKHLHPPPCFHCDALSPSESPMSYAPAPERGPQPPFRSLVSPGPSVTNSASPPEREPCHPPSPPPKTVPGNHPYAPVPSEHSPYSAIPPQHKQLGPVSQLPPKLSPSSPAVAYGTSPVKGKGSGMAPASPFSVLSPVSPSSTCELFLLISLTYC
ncbi:DNA-directed RNA polymerase II subunit RPB1 [Cocos nucifera]|uniref:DNA-directed RNA polymerase II subunit RPB1 n=1 Tax=Cocos nucifera TaxID=13894 RepID=A0A8K0IT76_COCNU|nr:DNA-directed RNA polymerase II subunit RPB1 [Cocos nucifera]